MKRFFIISFLSIAGLLVLGACSSQSQATPTSTLQPTATVVPVTSTPQATCSSVTAQPTPATSSGALFPPVTKADFSYGPQDAPITVLEYCDFQSEGCHNMATIIATLMQNSQNVRFIFRPFPMLGINDKSDKSLLAALAADQQGKFWEMYDLLFTRYQEWVSLAPNNFNAWVIPEAVKAGLDGNQLQVAMNAAETKTRMMSLYDTAKQIGIPAVPLVLINGVLQSSYALNYKDISDTIGLIALGQKQFTQCPPFNVDMSKQYLATLHTDKGDIIIQLFPDKAPLAVNSFVFLAQQGWFNGVTFHRVIPGFIAQSGDPSGTGQGGPGYFFNNESNNLKFDKPGMVGMANSGPDTNGSQFFITFAPESQLDGKYTIFGQVLKGLEVAENLTPRDPTTSSNLTPGDKILSVDIEVK